MRPQTNQSIKGNKKIFEIILVLRIKIVKILKGQIIRIILHLSV